jgi:thiol-disulfide isomerase/thioredoxin
MFTLKRTLDILSVMLLASGCTTQGMAPARQLRQLAPDFSLQVVDGRQIFLSHLRGKVIVLDFWATWCPPCREGLPNLQSLSANADMSQRGLDVLAVNEEEKPETIRRFLGLNLYTFAVLQDADGSTARAYSVSTLPTTIVIDRDGFVQAVISGWTQDEPRRIDEAVMHALDAPIR